MHHREKDEKTIVMGLMAQSHLKETGTMSESFHTLVEQNSVVKMSYTLHAFDPTQQSELTLVESRDHSDPFEFLMGHGWTHPKVEARLMGQRIGFKDAFQISHEEGFGEYDPSLALEISADKFPSEINLEVGMKFQTQGPDGQLISVIVKELRGDKILVDGNHPLAGLGLVFNIELLGVRSPTPEEVAKKKALPLFH